MMNALFRNLIKLSSDKIPVRIQVHIRPDVRWVLSQCYGRDPGKNRPPYGARPLVNSEDIFLFNNWDNVVWDEEQESDARKITSEQLKGQLSAEQQEEYEANAGENWNKFYNQHNNRFFKDRHWLFTEFPELAPEDSTLKSAESHDSPSTNTSGANDIPESSDKLRDRNLPVDSVGGQAQAGDCCGSNSGCEDQDQVVKYECEGEQDNSKKSPDTSYPHPPPDTSPCPAAVADNICDTTNCDNVAAQSFPGENSSFRIFEVGCGVGNTVFPVLQTNNDPSLMVYCCDFSSTAIQLVKEHHDYTPQRCHAFVCDVTDDTKPFPFPEGSLDLIILIFVLSAIHPEKMQYVVNRLSKHLKPGGTIMFRDYGRYDMAQLRFKKGRCLSQNFYVRGDGTRVYFFTQDELKTMFTKAGLKEKQNYIDRRLQVNRGRQLKMYRVWIQCKYTKPDLTNTETCAEGRTTPVSSETPT